MHNIIKDGSYIQYARKIIPNPFAALNEWTPIKKLAEKEVTVSTTSTTATEVASIEIDLTGNKNVIYWLKIRDEAGFRSGYFNGSDNFFAVHDAAPNTTYSGGKLIYYNSSFVSTSTWGIYCTAYGALSTPHRFSVQAKYNSSLGTLDGTFLIELYEISVPEV